jgi:hypothetical protein
MLFSAVGSTGARAGRRLKSVKALARSISTIDPVAEIIDLAPLLPKPPVAPIGARIGASDEARAIAGRLAETPKERRAREQAELKRESEAREAFTRRLAQNNKDAG